MPKIESPLPYPESKSTFSLQEQHNSISNLTLRKKLTLLFSSQKNSLPTNSPTAEELERSLQYHWLNDKDLERSFEQMGLTGAIQATVLDRINIGVNLAFKRKAHGASTEAYAIPLLLTTPTKNHWSRAIVYVTPPDPAKNRAKGSLRVSFTDSSPLTSARQEEIRKELLHALCYEEDHEDKRSSERQSKVETKKSLVFQVFPSSEYDVEKIDIQSSNEQTDSWSCGYRALHGLVTDHEFPPIAEPITPALQALRAVKVLEVNPHIVSAKLRQVIVTAELHSLKTSAADIEAFLTQDTVSVTNHLRFLGVPAADTEIFFPTKAPALRTILTPSSGLDSKSSYNSNNYAQATPRAPDSKPDSSSREELTELLELQKKIASARLDINRNLKPASKPDDKTASLILKDSMLTIDMANLLQADKDEISRTAKLIALVLEINHCNTITSICMEEIPDEMAIQSIAEQFNNLRNIIGLTIQGQELPLELQVITQRNLLLKKFNIHIKEGENPWRKLWKCRMENPSLSDAHDFLLKDFSTHFFPDSDTNELNALITACGSKYLEEFLLFINHNRGLYENSSAGFPYQRINIGQKLNSHSKTSSTHNTRLISHYLDTLIDYFKNEPSAYFPFTRIDLHLTGYIPEHFNKIKEFLALASKYDNLLTVGLHLFKYDEPSKNISSYDLPADQKDHADTSSTTERTLPHNPAYFTAKQYDEIADIFTQHATKFNLILADITQDLVTFKHIKNCENISVINRRHYNIAKRAGEITPVTRISTTQATVSRKKLAHIGIRPYKLSRLNINAVLGIETSIEQQRETQQQIQHQTEQQAESQQIIAPQQQSEFGSYYSTIPEDKLITKNILSDDKHLTEHLNHLGIINQKIYDKPQERLAWAIKGACGPLDMFPTINEAIMNPSCSFKEALSVDFWDGILGDSQFSNSIKYVTPIAFNSILKHVNFFADGFNPDNLPVGFTVSKYSKDGQSDGLILDFGMENQADEQKQTDLAIKLKTFSLHRKEYYGDWSSIDQSANQILDKLEQCTVILRNEAPNELAPNTIYAWSQPIQTNHARGAGYRLAYRGKIGEHEIDEWAEFPYEKIAHPADLKNKLTHIIANDFHTKVNTIYGLVSDQDETKYSHSLSKTITGATIARAIQSLNNSLYEQIKKEHAWCLALTLTVDDEQIGGEYDLLPDFTDDTDPDSDSLLFKKNAYLKLIGILHEHGCEGLKTFLDALKLLAKTDIECYKQFKDLFIDGPNTTENIEHLVDENVLKAIQELAQLNPYQRQWWMKLIAQHIQKYRYNTGFHDLFLGFKLFLQQTPVEITARQCPIQNNTHMLVALDRLLVILSKVPASNLADQLNYLDHLTTHQDDAWYAARWDGFHFFHEKMGLKASFFNHSDMLFYEKTILGRETRTYKVEFDDLRKLASTSSQSPTVNLSYPTLLFHRYLGGANYLHHNYDYYTQLIETLQSRRFSYPITMRMLALLGISTTGKRGHKVPEIATINMEDEKLSYPTNRRALSLLGISIPDEKEPKMAPVATTTMLFNFIAKSQDNDRLIPVLDTLVAEIGKVGITPNLAELSALIKLLQEIPGQQHSPQAVLQSLQPLSLANLQAINFWCMNPCAIPAENFYAFYLYFSNFHPENKDKLLILIASLRNTELNDEGIYEFISALDLLKSDHYGQYQNIVELFSMFNLKSTFDKSGTTQNTVLPTLSKMCAILTRINADPINCLSIVRSELPGCRFDSAALLEGITTDIASIVEKHLGKLNAYIEQIPGVHQLENKSTGSFLFKTEELIGECAINNINTKFSQLDIAAKTQLTISKDNPELNLVIRTAINFSLSKWDTATKPMLAQKITEILRNMFIHEPFKAYLSPFPDIHALSQHGWELGKLSEQYQAIGHDFKLITEYAAKFSELVRHLTQWQSAEKWGVNPLISLITWDILPKLNNRPLTIDKTLQLIASISKLDTTCFPAKLINTIFNGRVFTSEVDLDHYMNAVLTTLDNDFFNTSQKTALIEIVCRTTPLTGKCIIDNLAFFKQHHPELLNPCFKLYQQAGININQEFIQSIRHLCEIFGQNTSEQDSHLRLAVFNSLAAAPENIAILTSSLLSAPLLPQPRQLKLLAAIYYSYLQSPTNEPANNADFAKLTAFAHNATEDHFNQFVEFYQTYPQPKLTTLLRFIDLYGTSPDEASDFCQKYQLDPHGHRASAATLAQQFDISRACECIDQIEDLLRPNNYRTGHGQPLFYSQRKELLDNLVYINSVGYSHNLFIPFECDNKNAYQKPVKDLTNQHLQNLIQNYLTFIQQSITEPLEKHTIHVAKLEYLALVREAMYRANGKFPHSTQMIAVLNTMLQSGSVISEIRTGEGKGIITCLFNALQLLRSTTLKSTSSNMTLAQRDADEFSAFYSLLGIPSKVITSHSPALEKISYSTVAETALLQERLELEQHELGSLSITVDEFDDAANDVTEYRYSTILEPLSDPDINPYEAFYPFVYDFVTQNDFIHTLVDKNVDISNFHTSVMNHPDLQPQNTRLSAREKQRILNFFCDPKREPQLDRWIDAAYYASQLKQDEHFAIRTEKVLLNGEEHDRSVAKVKRNDRVIEGSTFSNAVHEFLHIRLNKAITRNQLFVASDNSHRDRVQHRFHIKPEKSSLAARGSKNEFDLVLNSGGAILGLTGTVGSSADVLRLHQTYGVKIFRIPPHHKFKRINHPPIIAAPQQRFVICGQVIEDPKTAHHRKIFEYIKISLNRGQPALVFCKTVGNTEELYQYVTQRLTAQEKQRLQVFNGENNGGNQELTEAQAIQRASNGMITITNSQLARGTDISPQRWGGREQHKLGLLTIDTCITNTREFAQRKGRSARNGAPGESRLILSTTEIHQHSQQYNLPAPKTNEPTQIVTFMEKVQQNLDLENYQQLRERQFYADIKEQYFNQYVMIMRDIKKQFCNHAIPIDNRLAWKQLQYGSHLLWYNFQLEMDKQWGELKIQLHNEIQAEKNRHLRTAPLDNACFDAYIEKLLTEKIKELIQTTNQNWQAESNNIQQQGYQVINEQRSNTNDLTIAASISLEDIEPTTIAAFEPLEAPKLYRDATWPAPTSAAREILDTSNLWLDISAKPLQKDHINPNQIYADFTATTDATLKQKALQEELTYVFSKLSPFNRKLVSNGQLQRCLFYDTRNHTLLETNQRLMQVCLNTILQQCYSPKPLNHTRHSTAHLRELYRKTIAAIGKYADADADADDAMLIKKTAYNLLKSHLEKYADNTHYYPIAIDMLHTASKWRMTKQQQGTCGLKDDVLKQFMSERLRKYNSWFMATDRKVLRNRLNNSLKQINFSNQQHLRTLLDELNDVSLTAAQDDLAADKNRTLRAYRNANGSDFQKALKDMRDRVAISLAEAEGNQSPASVVSTADFANIKDFLEILLERTQLPKYKNNSIINQMNQDTVLKPLIDSIKRNKLSVDNFDKLQQIHDRLVYYKQALHSGSGSHSEHAFWHFLDDQIQRITQIISLQQKLEMDQNTPFPSLTTREHQLRQAINTRLRSLVFLDDISPRHIDLSYQQGFISNSHPNAALHQVALHEIMRLVQRVYGANIKTNMLQVTEEEENKLIIRLQVMTTHPDETHQLDLVVHGLQPKNALVTCSIPTYQKPMDSTISTAPLSIPIASQATTSTASPLENKRRSRLSASPTPSSTGGSFFNNSAANNASPSATKPEDFPLDKAVDSPMRPGGS